MADRITTDDYISISDHLARYCWHVDNDEADEWALLWTEDGVLTGGSEPFVGREALKGVPHAAFKAFGGKMRHFFANLHGDYGETRDTVHARYYNMVSTWEDGGKLYCLALAEAILVRDGGGWKIKREDLTILI